MDTVTLTIDGIEIKAKKGEKILWAALDNGIYIPNLCAIRDAEEPSASCRLCFVEIEGRPNPVTSCTEPVGLGMVVYTKTPRVERLRRAAFELLIANHDVDCRNCAKNRHCELQKIAAFLKVKLKPERFRKTLRQLPIDYSSPFFIRDPNKCVLCGKCVWVCNEHVGAGVIDFTFRGFDAVIAPFGGGPIIESRCESCGECVAICPVGALVPKNLKFPSQEVKTICPYCSVGCGIYLGTDDKGTIVNIRGDEESPVNKGSLCGKGRFAIAGMVHHPERLTSPLIRQNGELVETSWDEALKFVGSNLAKYRGSQFGLISSAEGSNEENYLLQKFARTVMETNNIDSCPPLQLSQSLGGAMANHISDIDSAACILAIGTDATVTHPIIGWGIRRAVRKGAKLIVANPDEIELCRHATLWLRHSPGSDVTLLMGMMHTILDEGLADWSFIEEQCEGFDAFQESVHNFEPKFVEQVTGVPSELLAEAARIYATVKPATIIYAPDDSDNALAIANLAMLTGNIGLYRLHGQNNAQGTYDMGLVPDFYPGYQPVADPKARQKFEAAWGCRLNPNPELNLDEIIRAAQRGEIRALYTIGANPIATMADAEQVKQALEKLDFFIVQDLFLTETARLAHIVLPAASFAEKDGTFTNVERRVQRVRKAIEPIGDAKPDWWIICQIAERLGGKGFDFAHPSQIMDEIAALTPIYSDISYERLEQEGFLCPYSLGEGKRFRFYKSPN